MAMSIRNRIALGYPINVMCDVLKIKPTDPVSGVIKTVTTKLPLLSKNFAGALDSFTPKQKSAIMYYYKSNLPAALVAQKIDCSPQRVRQLISAAIKKLGTPDIIEILQGQNNDFNIPEDSKFNHFVYTTFGTLDVPYDTPIESYDLSRRAYNCLKNNNINTLGKVLIYDYERKFVGIRNLGDGSVAEIRRKLYVLPPSDESLPLGENMSYAGKQRLIWLARQLESKIKPTQGMCHEAAKQLRFLASVEDQLGELFAAFYISVDKE